MIYVTPLFHKAISAEFTGMYKLMIGFAKLGNWQIIFLHFVNLNS